MRNMIYFLISFSICFSCNKSNENRMQNNNDKQYPILSSIKSNSTKNYDNDFKKDSNNISRIKQWSCGTCTYLNSQFLNYCELCGKSKEQKNNQQQKTHSINQTKYQENDMDDEKEGSSYLNHKILDKEIKISTSKILKYINNKNKDYKTFMFFGKKGDGKSTAINHLLNNTKEIKKEMNSVLFKDIYKNGINEGNKIKSFETKLIQKNKTIGPFVDDNIGIGVTKYICPYFLNENNNKFCFVDTCGFENKEKGIANCIANNLWIKSHDKIDGICLLATPSDFDSERGKNIIKYILNIIDYLFIDNLNKNEDPLKSVFLLFNKVYIDDYSQALFNIYSKLTKFKEKFKEKINHTLDDDDSLNENSKYEKYIEVIKKILDYQNILIMKPTKEKSRDMILKQLNNSIPIRKKNFKFIGKESTKRELFRFENDAINNILLLLKNLENIKKEIISSYNNYNLVIKELDKYKTELKELDDKQQSLKKLIKKNIKENTKTKLFIKKSKKDINQKEYKRKKESLKFYQSYNQNNNNIIISEIDKQIMDGNIEINKFNNQTLLSEFKKNNLNDKKVILNDKKESLLNQKKRSEIEIEKNIKYKNYLIDICTLEEYLEHDNWFEYYFSEKLKEWVNNNIKFNKLSKLNDDLKKT